MEPILVDDDDDDEMMGPKLISFKNKKSRSNRKRIVEKVDRLESADMGSILLEIDDDDEMIMTPPKYYDQMKMQDEVERKMSLLKLHDDTPKYYDQMKMQDEVERKMSLLKLNDDHDEVMMNYDEFFNDQQPPCLLDILGPTNIDDDHHHHEIKMVTEGVNTLICGAIRVSNVLKIDVMAMSERSNYYDEATRRKVTEYGVSRNLPIELMVDYPSLIDG